MGRGQAARKTGAVATTFVALLRGVGVGPAKWLAMAAAQAAFEAAGGRAVEPPAAQRQRLSRDFADGGAISRPSSAG